MPKAFQLDAFQYDAFQLEFPTALLVPPLYLFQRAVGIAMNKRAMITELKPRTFEITIKDK